MVKIIVLIGTQADFHRFLMRDFPKEINISFQLPAIVFNFLVYEAYNYIIHFIIDEKKKEAAGIREI